jgi:hypothetical protein
MNSALNRPSTPASTAESRDTFMDNPENKPLEDRIAELQETVQTQKGIIENLQEVIKARDMELILLENTVKVKEIALQNFYDSRSWKVLSGFYQKVNQLLPPDSRRRKMASKLFPKSIVS